AGPSTPATSGSWSSARYCRRVWRWRHRGASCWRSSRRPARSGKPIPACMRSEGLRRSVGGVGQQRRSCRITSSAAEGKMIDQAAAVRIAREHAASLGWTWREPIEVEREVYVDGAGLPHAVWWVTTNARAIGGNGNILIALDSGAVVDSFFNPL